MSRARWLIVVAVLLALALGGWLWLQGRGDEQQTARVTEGSLDVTIQTTGVLYAANPALVRSPSGALIDVLGVRVGDVVAQGDIIAILAQEPFDDAVRDATRGLERAEFALQLAESRLANDSGNADLRLAAVSASEDVTRARRSVDDAEQARRDSVVLSPIDGVVVELNVRAGDGVGAQQQIARVVAPQELELRASVDELDMPNVAPGAAVRFRPDAFPASEIEGVVSRIAPQGRNQNGATVFDVTITFTTPDDVPLRPETNAEVTITTASRDQVLLIPERALRTVGDRVFVDVVREGDTVEQEISVGYRGNGQVEVVNGLSLGDEVVLR